MSRLALVQALEALEAGDSRFAVDVLLTALEELDEQPRLRQRCRHCGFRCEWPGQLADHLRVVHDELEAA